MCNRAGTDGIATRFDAHADALTAHVEVVGPTCRSATLPAKRSTDAPRHRVVELEQRTCRRRLLVALVLGIVLEADGRRAARDRLGRVAETGSRRLVAVGVVAEGSAMPFHSPGNDCQRWIQTKHIQ